MENKNIQLYLGDCKDIMKSFPDNSIDTIISDPPYGLSFMGKKWDYDVPSIDIWKECLKVLKPGGTALIFAGSRTQHRMACNVEDAGFILKDCILWVYATGFPKATDISKQLDKGHKRKIIGKRNVPDQRSGGINSQRTAGIGVPTRIIDVTSPSTPEAKLWSGWKSHGLKPAYEPILVAIKPNEGTYAENAIKHGVSGLNIDEARIGTDEITGWGGNPSNGYSGGLDNKQKARPIQGRFPANIILECICEDVKNEKGKAFIHTNPNCPCYMLDKQSGDKNSTRVGNPNNGKKGGSMFGGAKQKVKERSFDYRDKGGASRFFYVAKASKRERNMGCENLPKKQKVFNGQSAKSSKELKDVEERFTTQPSANNHPTVKPLELMKYLCTLTKTPTGGIVLDPFMGSGTTGMACKLTGRKFIGIEMNEEYMKIAQERIKSVK